MCTLFAKRFNITKFATIKLQDICINLVAISKHAFTWNHVSQSRLRKVVAKNKIQPFKMSGA